MQGANIGDVFVSSAKVHHDRRIPIPGFDAYGIGRLDSCNTPAMAAALGLKTGIVSSGNSLDYTDKCLEAMAASGAAVKEMEAAAVGWVADMHGLPCFCVKAITDIVDGGRPSHEEFLENLAAAATALQDMLPRVLAFMDGKTPSQL